MSATKLHTIEESKLKAMLEAAFSAGYDAGGRNERASLHDTISYDDERDAHIVDAFTRID